jgi:hypothetical protein
MIWREHEAKMRRRRDFFMFYGGAMFGLAVAALVALFVVKGGA